MLEKQREQGCSDEELTFQEEETDAKLFSDKEILVSAYSHMITPLMIELSDAEKWETMMAQVQPAATFFTPSSLKFCTIDDFSGPFQVFAAELWPRRRIR